MATQKQTAVQESVLDILGKYRKQIAAVVPRRMEPDRMFALIVAAFNQVPKLHQCTPISTVNAVVTAAAMGLEIRDRSAYLIPYKDNKRGVMICQLLLDYRAKMMLAERNPDIRYIVPMLVYPQDEWEYWIEDGTPHFKHVPNLESERSERFDKKTNTPPSIRCVYGGAYVSGRLRLEVMTLEQIEAIRKRSKAGNDGPWITDWAQMARKTVNHRVFNHLSFDPLQEYGKAAIQSQEVDDAYETGKHIEPAFEIEPGDLVTVPSEPQRKAETETESGPPSEEEMKRTEQETLAREAGQDPKVTPRQGSLGQRGS